MDVYSSFGASFGRHATMKRIDLLMNQIGVVTFKILVGNVSATINGKLSYNFRDSINSCSFINI